MRICTWDRPTVKYNAKLALSQGRFGIALGVTITAGIVTEILSVWVTPFLIGLLDRWLYLSGPTAETEGPALGGMVFLFSIAVLLADVFLVYPLSIGKARFFVRNRFAAGRYRDVWSGFEYSYLKGTLSLFTTDLILILWSFLLVVPGIIKFYQYRMVSFLVSDNPELGGSRAREISRQLTDGQKGALFLLDLSFFGWLFLNAFVAGMVSILFPFLGNLVSIAGAVLIGVYQNACFAEVYFHLRDEAIGLGLVYPQELNLLRN